jgi:hypothetical protein
MRVITIQRTISKRRQAKIGADHWPPLRESIRSFFASEHHLEFALEAVLFAILLAVSAWPIIAAAGAINELFQRVPT